jgi:cyclopropane-fatty-acyl-phospholipid synthase
VTDHRNEFTRSVASTLAGLLGVDQAVAIRAYDGSHAGPSNAVVTVEIRSPVALRRIVAAPGELGLARAYVAGDIDVHGDLCAVLDVRDRLGAMSLGPRAWVALVQLMGGVAGLRRPPAPPPEEARVRGRLHTRARDAAAISHHYDVSADFYRLLLGPTMTYSCGVWQDPSVGLDAAQEAKYDLICRKLDLAPGMRLLDVGCGWGGMAMHAARHHGVRVVGVTISAEQVALARHRVAEAGLDDRVEIRLADYRDVRDGPYQAISSIGMFEHVGSDHLGEYFARMHGLLAPGGRLLNHGISRAAGQLPMDPQGFIQRYVFPDGELQEIGDVVCAVQNAGLEVRHVENLREHYALTLRAWVRNIEDRHDEAVTLAGAGRARVW